MDDIYDALHKAGVPSFLIAALAIAWITLDKLRLFSRPARKSPEEVLSEGQIAFRQDLMQRLNDSEEHGDKRYAELEARHRSQYAALETSHHNCEVRVAEMSNIVLGIMQQIRRLYEVSLNPPPIELLDLAARADEAIAKSKRGG